MAKLAAPVNANDGPSGLGIVLTGWNDSSGRSLNFINAMLFEGIRGKELSENLDETARARPDGRVAMPCRRSRKPVEARHAR